ncbi:MAG: hypothetical protein KGL54_12400 [Sphingomonadales bacterium]|nr:hypothetical protein [Sphingomonadales bacterium]
MAQLTPEQARIADDAVAKVQTAQAAAQEAIDAEWAIIDLFTDSESAAAARRESLRQTTKILDQLVERRPGLTAEGLVGFVQLAGAGAQVSELLDGARRATAAGFTREVVKPTLSDLNPLNASGVVGRVLLAGALAGLVLLYFKLRD